MATTVNIHEAKTHFSKLLVRVQAGEEIIVARAGVPIARLVPPAPAGKRVPPPEWAKVVNDIPESVFFTPLTEEELAEWEGQESEPRTPI